MIRKTVNALRVVDDLLLSVVHLAGYVVKAPLGVLDHMLRPPQATPVPFQRRPQAVLLTDLIPSQPTANQEVRT